MFFDYAMKNFSEYASKQRAGGDAADWRIKEALMYAIGVKALHDEEHARATSGGRGCRSGHGSRGGGVPEGRGYGSPGRGRGLYGPRASCSR